MKNSTYSSNRLDDLYGPTQIGPLPAGATNWKQIAIYSCVAGGVIVVFLYGIHLINSHNTKLFAAQIKPTLDRNKDLQGKIDKISLELEDIKTQQSLKLLKTPDASSLKDINHEESV